MWPSDRSTADKLLVYAQEGDVNAMAELLAQLRPWLLSEARRLLRRERLRGIDADDLVQETYHLIFVSMDEHRHEGLARLRHAPDRADLHFLHRFEDSGALAHYFTALLHQTVRMQRRETSKGLLWMYDNDLVVAPSQEATVAISEALRHLAVRHPASAFALLMTDWLGLSTPAVGSALSLPLRAIAEQRLYGRLFLEAELKGMSSTAELPSLQGPAALRVAVGGESGEEESVSAEAALGQIRAMFDEASARMSAVSEGLDRARRDVEEGRQWLESRCA